MRTIPIRLFLLLASALVFRNAFAEIHAFNPASYYQGTIDKSPIRILIAEEDSMVYGFLFYEKTGVPFWLSGVRTSKDSILLTEFLDTESWYSDRSYSDESKRTGNLRLKLKDKQLSGTWVHPVSGKKLPLNCRLNEEPMPPPDKLAGFLSSESSRMEIITNLSRWLTGPLPNFFYMESRYERWADPPEIPASFLGPEDIEPHIVAANLTDAEGEEVLLQLGILDFRSLFFVLQKSGTGWQALPDFLDERADYDMVDCPYEEGAPFVVPLLVPSCSGKSVLQLRIETGRCGDGSWRGGHVDRKLYRLMETGIIEIIWIEEHDYWYESPCGNPINLPVDVAFEYVKEPGAAFASKLKCTHKVYRMEQVDNSDGCSGFDAVELGEAVQWVELCED